MSDSRDKIPSDKTSRYEDVAAPAASGMSRRRLFQTLVGSAAALGTGLALALPEPADAKTPKKLARYQDHPKGSQHCSECRFFVKPASCKLVAGKISPNGWCSFFAKKA
jgi:hypothetical protein